MAVGPEECNVESGKIYKIDGGEEYQVAGNFIRPWKNVIGLNSRELGKPQKSIFLVARPLRPLAPPPST